MTLDHPMTVVRFVPAIDDRWSRTPHANIARTRGKVRGKTGSGLVFSPIERFLSNPMFGLGPTPCHSDCMLEVRWQGALFIGTISVLTRAAIPGCCGHVERFEPSPSSGGTTAVQAWRSAQRVQSYTLAIVRIERGLRHPVSLVRVRRFFEQPHFLLQAAS